MAYTTIDNPELYFQAKTYTGNGSTQSITLDGDENMQPDFVWIKERDDTSNHNLYDAVRGVQKYIYSNETTEELEGGDSMDVQSTVSMPITIDWRVGITLNNDENVNAVTIFAVNYDHAEM